MTILVTGATGNVGRHLVHQLLAEGRTVRALTRNPANANLPSEVEVVKGELTDAARLAGVFDGANAAFLITFDGATYAPLTNGAEIVALAREAGVERVALLEGDVEGSALSQAVADGGLPWTRLGPYEFMSNLREWIPSIRDEGVVREAFPEAKSAMVHDADIAAVARAALTEEGHAGQTYWITGPAAITTREKVDILAAGLGRNIRYVELSTEEVTAQWRESGFSEEDVEFFLQMRTDPPEAGYTVQPTVEKVTGRPARSLAEWVREHAAEFGPSDA
ncbi:NAD(P)H-binding protein [Spiractinospora alimapuensis]|uniref:NmrA family NAD(P)-binding protein n=1 Tax=Spiractinospora alimapuensis TaxID=2820884 RepID=UPI001F421CDF|nr:NAD(P)H-binding protein [Spiractinospora alimapuensis]QVQ50761.1 NAD(P)H-binding protein [Spiractinospora alimapuensis]